MKKYRVLFLGLLEDLDFFKRRMSELGIKPAVSEQIVRRAPVVLKAGMTLGDARRYADAVLRAGGKVNIQEDGVFETRREMSRPLSVKPFEYFTMCPECGHKQPKGERCVRCGRLLLDQGEGSGRNR